MTNRLTGRARIIGVPEQERPTLEPRIEITVHYVWLGKSVAAGALSQLLEPPGQALSLLR